MLPDPLHPAVVHFPVALAFVAPLLALLGAVLVAKGVKPLHGWSPVVLVTLLLVAGAVVAVETGEDQEERVEAIVPEDALELHEERAELLRNVAVVALLLAGVGLLDGRKGWVGRGLAVVTLVGALVVAWRAGETGGELVYRHGAASAYVDPGGPSRTATPAVLERHD
ncbi:MAG TPA: DUF2231 domain-containing protein [Gemmatimonadales bacterium]|nr:DUF2231 domain-containing protein [Gemmatimonadales bacterium]